MSYLAKLKQLEDNENFNNTPNMEPTKPTKLPFGSFGGMDSGNIEKNITDIAELQAETIRQEMTIRSWLKHIEEPEEDHHIVIDKCRRNPEAMQYFLKHAEGELEKVITKKAFK